MTTEFADGRRTSSSRSCLLQDCETGLSQSAVRCSWWLRWSCRFAQQSYDGQPLVLAASVSALSL